MAKSARAAVDVSETGRRAQTGREVKHNIPYCVGVEVLEQGGDDVLAHLRVVQAVERAGHDRRLRRGAMGRGSAMLW